MDVDLRLYALIDPAVAGGRTLADLAARIAGSATLVQLRDKHGSTRAMVEEARALPGVLAPLDIPLLINDRVDVALAAEADGVHIGQDDMSPADARLLLGRTAIIGLSIKTVAAGRGRAARAARLCGDRRRLRHDLEGQYRGADRARRPARGRAGDPRAQSRNFRSAPSPASTQSNAAEVIAAGADGVAVISALSLAPDPAQAAQDLRAVVDDALARRGRA